MEWIKVEDEKPEDGRQLLLYHKVESIGGVELGFYDMDNNNFIELETDMPITVLYWSYITMPPEEEKCHWLHEQARLQ